MVKKLDTEEIETALNSLPGWELTGNEIKAQYVFVDFRQAFGFMTEIALWAEKLNHHPTWSNTYNRVDVTLTTHDADGITGLDIELAQAMNDAASVRH